MIKLQTAWFVVSGMAMIAALPAVAPYMARETAGGYTHFAALFARPCSEMYFSVREIGLKRISPEFNQGIVPGEKNEGLRLLGVPPL